MQFWSLVNTLFSKFAFICLLKPDSEVAHAVLFGLSLISQRGGGGGTGNDILYRLCLDTATDQFLLSSEPSEIHSYVCTRNDICFFHLRYRYHFSVALF